jgi:hypothetical protein
MNDLITTITYPRGTTFVSGTVSEGTLNSTGTKWKGVDLLEGESVTFKFFVDITSEALFESGDKTVKAVTMTYPAEIVTINNTILKVIE